MGNKTFTGRSWSTDKKLKIKRMVSEGKTRQEIADYFGVTRSAIGGVIDRMTPKEQKPREQRQRPHAPVFVTQLPDEAPDGYKLLSEAKAGECRFPPLESGHIICSKPTEPGKPYCFDCAAKAYTGKRYVPSKSEVKKWSTLLVFQGQGATR